MSFLTFFSLMTSREDSLKNTPTSNDKNFKFYSDQKGPRFMKCFIIVETLTTSDVKFAEKALG